MMENASAMAWNVGRFSGDTTLPLRDGAATIAVTGAPLSVHNLTVVYNREPVLENVDWQPRAHRLTAIVGPNGAGKSTLLKAVLGLVPAIAGDVEVYGTSLAEARDRIGYVPQRSTVDWDFPVSAREVVGMGRYRKIGWLRRTRPADRKAADAALAAVGLAEYADRQIGQLSGGQQQRVFLARALAQEPDLYLLDEPFAGVDAATEATILEVLRGLKREGKSIIVVHHDLATVRDWFDDVLLLDRTRIAAGPVADVFTGDNLAATYGGKLVVFSEGGSATAVLN